VESGSGATVDGFTAKDVGWRKGRTKLEKSDPVVRF